MFHFSSGNLKHAEVNQALVVVTAPPILGSANYLSGTTPMLYIYLFLYNTLFIWKLETRWGSANYLSGYLRPASLAQIYSGGSNQEPVTIVLT